jgi:hypothetical protein
MQNWMIENQKLELSPEHEQVLRDQTINEDGPGVILRDFEALLTYIDERNPAVTPKQRLLSLGALPEINERLTHPLELGLKRPVQKSYPPIHGLYLLVRASGLTRIEGNTLLVDKEAAQSWAALNSTERYFTLLESWLLRGRPEIVGERGFGVAGENLSNCATFANRVPDEGLQIAGAHNEEGLLSYTPGWHNLGLLDLFGLMTVHDAPSEQGEGWRIERIERTPFGDALLALLSIDFFSGWSNLAALEQKPSIPFGVLQPVVQPYFPEWEENLRISEDEFQEGIYVFKVSLGRIWRRIAIPADRTLDGLAHAILNAVAFDRDHLYTFTYRNRFGASEEVHHPYMDERPWTDKVHVGDLPLSTGQAMTFVFDFGDWWEFNVELERIESVEAFPSLKGAVVLEEQGEAPDQYRDWA